MATRRRRSLFNLSGYHLTTCNMGQLIPVGLQEVNPGDTFRHATSALIRLSPLAAPVMHPVTVRVHHFFVPHRLIWERAGGTGKFEDFMTGGDGTDVQTVPTMENDGVAGELPDYYGIPTHGESLTANFSALPVVGFNSIFNEYFRDQDLVGEKPDLDKKVPLIAWEKDYLTSARPWPQKGPEVTLPLGEKAFISSNALGGETIGVQAPGIDTDTHVMSTSGPSLVMDATGAPSTPDDNRLFADLTGATAASVNELRRALALQRYQENRARFGSRYTEYLRFLGITPSDARLDRPEYLGGGRVQVATSEVLQTAPEGATPVRDYGVGDMYGHGVAAVRANSYQRFFEEHGYVHTLMSVRPKAMYLQGVPRHFFRQVKEDFHQRELEHIGQQEVLNNEVFMDAVNGTGVFGYQDRYREYREGCSHVSAEFRNILNYWHLARDFGTAPALNQTFVECDPSKRIFNEQTQHSLWIQVQHKVAARRLISRVAAPRIL